MREPTVYFFDMDHTLIDNDCDVSWKHFMVEKGLAPESDIEDAERFWQLYKANELPFEEFTAFQFREFVGRTVEEMRELADEHFQRHALTAFYSDAIEEVERALATGAPVAIVSSTNDVVVRPVAEHLGIPHALVTPLEAVDGRYTGRLAGPYCIDGEKVRRARAFCEERDIPLETAAYYGDSIADIPLLEAVGRPTVINPDKNLLDAARSRGWRIESWER